MVIENNEVFFLWKGQHVNINNITAQILKEMTQYIEKLEHTIRELETKLLLNK